MAGVSAVDWEQRRREVLMVGYEAMMLRDVMAADDGKGERLPLSAAMELTGGS